MTNKESHTDMKRCKLTIVRGLPGSGKSTYAKTHYNCLILENDMFHMKNGEYRWTATKMNDAINWCISMATIAISNGMDVVICNTFTRKAFVDSYKKIADILNADFEVIRCTGNYGNIHDVPQNVLTSMKESFEDYEGEVLV